MHLSIIFIVLSIIVAVGTGIYLKKFSPEAVQKRKTEKINKVNAGLTDSTQSSEKLITTKELSEIKKMWGIEDIRNGVVHLSNNKYRRILAMGSLDFCLLSREEQKTVENQLMQTSMALQFPVQFITTTERVDTQQTVKEIDVLINSEENNDKLKLYAQKMRHYLSDMMEDRGVYVRRSYAVVCSDGQFTAEKGIETLDRYAGTLMSTLSRAKITTTPLTTKQIVNLLYRELNKESPIVPSFIIDNGSMEMYSTGMGVLGDIDLDEIELSIEGTEATSMEAKV